jgi:2-methylcitrate dehydratase PrpD
MSAAPDLERPSITRALAARVATASWAGLTPQAITVARQMLLDWIGVSLAARAEPLVRILMEEIGAETQAQDCTLIGQPVRASLANAALINGAMSHALDFDDVISAMNGHPTVPVAPAVFALAEQLGASGRDALLAFITGVETETRVARALGPSHYARGWHCTGTFGTFGAAAAAAKLYGLDEEQTAHAFGLAGAQAAGLKSVFGTMAKPLHAGKAAQNGLLAARLARRGFTSDTEILSSPQGFADTQSSKPNPAAALADPPGGFHVVDALFKYHAACYLTHDAIEACDALRREEQVTPDEVESAVVRVHEGHLGICNIPDPQTGLECKFSLRMTTALALSGEDTFEDRLFSDETSRRPDLIALRRRVSVSPTAEGRGSTVELTLKDGRRLARTVDVAVPMRDLSAQQAKLERKFMHLAAREVGEERAARIAAVTRDLENHEVRDLLSLCGA